jgi:hypothetical protein
MNVKNHAHFTLSSVHRLLLIRSTFSLEGKNDITPHLKNCQAKSMFFGKKNENFFKFLNF